ncbi:MAG TPA: hypothetical protein VJ044_16755 [Candidatus Hodarchaeales archaeon]|nr:hypothetical protein [Candidatus Hodarchaeales archaeon]
MSTIKPIHSVKKFYFLEYFYVLLSSIEKYADKEQVFDSFKILKQQHRLGESKYKTLSSDSENLSKAQVNRYRYTFQQVIDEAKEYELLDADSEGNLTLTDEGKALLLKYRVNGPVGFNQSLFKLMEARYNAFRYLVEFLYNVNRFKPGLLIFPNYSPRQLHFEKSATRTTADIKKYSEALTQRLQQDIQKYLGEYRELAEENTKILVRLVESGLLPANSTAKFDAEKYNVITKRFRDFWITYFLREVYKYEFSMSSFDIWTYRGKQIGIMHATEFYPNFNGRIVYPTSVILPSTESSDFERLFEYADGRGLFVHKPEIERNQDKFVDSLVKAYFDLRRSNRSYFISLSALRELVCYNMKISEHLFETFLEFAYRLNLEGNLKIRISLEVDKLPEETKAMYLKQEPVMVDGRYRNIIAIDVTKGEKIA